MVDLMCSGKFNLVFINDMLQYFEMVEDVDYSVWVIMGVDIVFVGSIDEQGVNKYVVFYQFIDVLKG